METKASGDTSGSDGGRTAQDSVRSVSGVTEAGTSGNAAAGEEARWHGVGGDGRGEEDGLLTVVGKAVDDNGVDWEVEMTAAGDDDAAASSSPVRRTAARLGWLLLGFLAGAAVAAAVLFMMRHDSPVACTVVPT